MAVVIVGAYLLLNLVVVAVGFYEIAMHPQSFTDWTGALFSNYGNPLVMIGVSLLVFPRLALGLSGFETGVGMMPLVRGDEGDDPERPAGRIRNTRKMLTVAALVMSFYLITTSLVTTVLIPHEEFEEGGSANGRALAYLAHQQLGDAFGTAYDISTILILAFAGASAMAGLLNIVPRYLPRYGMAPEWGRAIRPLVIIYTTISIVVTIIFSADVDAQAGAYATGVLAMMTSAAFAVTLSSRRRGSRLWTLAFGLVTVVFVYALVANEIQRPDGLIISAFFIAAMIFASLVSRVYRSLELRQESIDLDETARQLIEEASHKVRSTSSPTGARRATSANIPEGDRATRGQPHPGGRSYHLPRDRGGGPLGVRGRAGGEGGRSRWPQGAACRELRGPERHRRPLALPARHYR